jgi:predicted nucleotidyltransferase
MADKIEIQGIDLEELRKYFAARQEVAFAFLYGSQAKGNATKRSDVDIAVYFYPPKRHPVIRKELRLERESKKKYSERNSYIPAQRRPKHIQMGIESQSIAIKHFTNYS